VINIGVSIEAQSLKLYFWFEKLRKRTLLTRRNIEKATKKDSMFQFAKGRIFSQALAIKYKRETMNTIATAKQNKKVPSLYIKQKIHFLKYCAMEI